MSRSNPMHRNSHLHPIFQQALAHLILQDAPARDVELGRQCPECDSRETESNGYSEFCCCECDHRWGREYGERYGY